LKSLAPSKKAEKTGISKESLAVTGACDFARSG